MYIYKSDAGYQVLLRAIDLKAEQRVWRQNVRAGDSVQVGGHKDVRTVRAARKPELEAGAQQRQSIRLHETVTN